MHMQSQSGSGDRDSYATVIDSITSFFHSYGNPMAGGIHVFSRDAGNIFSFFSHPYRG
jgi:hypothetical protein